ncbi:MAG: HAD family hydrolase [Chloroflexi bacterium]|nr:HAD family hydrolase [Chloroflexota bacterium]MQC26398.1 HAD family hydrolase [Chloroflexota bacterium]
MSDVNPGKLQAVIFDLDDTLRVNDPHAHIFFHDFVRTLGLNLRQDALHDSFRWAHEYWATSDDMLADLQAHNGMEDTFWQAYTRRHLNALGLEASKIDELADEVHQHMRGTYKPKSQLVPGALETLNLLRSRGHQVGVVTNRSRPIYQEIHDLELDLHLDFFITAGQVGAFKPQKELFEGVLNLIHLSADEVLYVGDNYFADVLGAEQAGIQAVLLDPFGLYPDVGSLTIASVADVVKLLESEALI